MSYHHCRLALIMLVAGPALASGYPRLANLWGCSTTTKEYDQWARYDLLVTAGAPESYRVFRRELRARNPEQIVLATAPLMDLTAGQGAAWMKDEWYLRRPDGTKILWWADQILTPNITRDDCLEALVQQTEAPFGDLLREGVIDGIFYDSVVGRATWLGEVDTDGDGKADDPAVVDPLWQARQNLFFSRLRAMHPGMLILANDVDAGHAAQVNGRLYEGAPLLDRLLTGSLSPHEAVRELAAWMKQSVQPGITFAIMTSPAGWQGWRVGRGSQVTTESEVDRVRRDFSRMRTGLATALMTDTYYAYDMGTVWYGLPLWYAEYDAPLGQPLAPAREVHEVPPTTVLDWSAGQPAEAFALDAATATPLGLLVEVTDAVGWQRVIGTRLSQIRLHPGNTYRIQAQCEIIRRPSQALQFNVRTARGGWEHHDKGVQQCGVGEGERWVIDTSVVPDDFLDYSMEWHMLGTGAFRLTRLLVQLVDESYLRRDFEGGSAFLNTTSHPVTVHLSRPLRRLKDDAAPRHIIEVDDQSPGFACQGAWEELAGECGYYGRGYRSAAKPGDTARWTFTAPAVDTYSLFATFPGGKALTGAAVYAVTTPSGQKRVPLDQRTGDGGWVKLAEVQLSAGERCTAALRSGGEGATVADAIRAESAARYNDGSTVTDLSLEPLGGAVLLTP